MKGWENTANRSDRKQACFVFITEAVKDPKGRLISFPRSKLVDIQNHQSTNSIFLRLVMSFFGAPHHCTWAGLSLRKPFINLSPASYQVFKLEVSQKQTYSAQFVVHTCIQICIRSVSSTHSAFQLSHRSNSRKCVLQSTDIQVDTPGFTSLRPLTYWC